MGQNLGINTVESYDQNEKESAFRQQKQKNITFERSNQFLNEIIRQAKIIQFPLFFIKFDLFSLDQFLRKRPQIFQLTQNILIKYYIDKMDSFGFDTQGQNYHKFRPKYPLQILIGPLKNLKHKNKYLDIATGTGLILFQVASHFDMAYGIDPSKKMIETASQQLNKYKNITLQISSLDQFQSKKNEKFDYITIGQALHFFSGYQSLSKIKNLLREDGKLTVYCYIAQNFSKKHYKVQSTSNDLVLQSFYQKVKPLFSFNRDQMHQLYNDSEKYPFDKIFSNVSRNILSVDNQVTRQDCIGYLKTLSGYNHFLKKYPEQQDPIKEVQNKLTEMVSIKLDYVTIQCNL